MHSSITECIYCTRTEEQHEVFAKWLEQGENMNNTEAELIIKKTKSAEVKGGYEELTVKEMVAKGFSAYPVCTGLKKTIGSQKHNTVLRYSSSKDQDRKHCQKGWNP